MDTHKHEAHAMQVFLFSLQQNIFTLLSMMSKYGVLNFYHPTLRTLSGCSLPFSTTLIWGGVVITLIILLHCPSSLHLTLSSHRDGDPCARWCCDFSSTETAPAHPHACQTRNLNHRALPAKTPTSTTDANSMYLRNCVRGENLQSPGNAILHLSNPNLFRFLCTEQYVKILKICIVIAFVLSPLDIDSLSNYILLLFWNNWVCVTLMLQYVLSHRLALNADLAFSKNIHVKKVTLIPGIRKILQYWE